MKLFEIILWILIVGFLYRFVVRFLFPILQITRAASGHVRDMQQKMDDMQRQANNTPPKPQPKETHHIDGDYIDYEEVK